MNQDQARELLEEAAEDLERGSPLDPSLLAYTVDALRCMARDLPHPATDGRGRPRGIDPYRALGEAVDAMQRRGVSWGQAVKDVAAKHDVDERTVCRAALRGTDLDDKRLELILLARAIRTK